MKRFITLALLLTATTAYADEWVLWEQRTQTVEGNRGFFAWLYGREAKTRPPELYRDRAACLKGSRDAAQNTVDEWNKAYPKQPRYFDVVNNGTVIIMPVDEEGQPQKKIVISAYRCRPASVSP